MLYLFNSGYRPKYVKNVLDTLFIPHGGTNEYRYRYKVSQGCTDVVNINPESLEKFCELPKKTEAAVIFIDRFASGGYQYHPLRMASSVLQRKSTDYLFFRMQLNDFVYPRDIIAFNKNFELLMHPKGVAKLTDNEPKGRHDGWYAMFEDDLFAQTADFMFGTSAWTSCVNQLHQCFSFSSKEEVNASGVEKENHYVFMRCDLRRNSKKTVTPSLIDNQAKFDLIKGGRYELELSYLYPKQLNDTDSKAILTVDLGDNLNQLGADDIDIDSFINSVPYHFSTKRNLEDYFDAICFNFKSAEEGVEIHGPGWQIPVRFRSSGWFWISIVLILILYGVLSVVIDADFSNIDPLTLCSALDALWINGIASVVQAFVLLWVFYLVGKRFF